MSDFDLDRVLALVRRLDGVGLDRRAQEEWSAFSAQVKEADAAWLQAHFAALVAGIHDETRIRARPLPEGTGGEGLRAAFWLTLWLYRSATRRPVQSNSCR